MSMESYLATDIVIHFLQFLGISSSVVLICLSKKARMFSNSNLLLMHILVISDLLHAVLIIPYSVYLTIGWNPVSVNYDPLFVIVSSTPLLIQLKVNLIIVIAIASDRLLAMTMPSRYRHKNHNVYAVICTLIAVSFGIFDVSLNLYLTPIESKPNCGAIGCFISSSFRYYWGTSNAILGLIVVILTLLMMYKLKTLSVNYVESEKTREGQRFSKANKSAVCTLITSVIFITVPSLFAGIFELTGYSAFRIVGPFYIVGLLMAGCVHCLSQIKMNPELRIAFKKTTIRVSVVESSRFS